MSKEKFYLTTAILYTNAVPHLGHSYELVATDVIARYKRLSGYDVFFLTGTDENSLNTERAARERGVDPLVYCDEIVGHIQEIWKALNISNDDFLRTTQERHQSTCQELYRRAFENGDIYKGTYEGWYCDSCEAYYTEEELDSEKQCTIHESPARWFQEENYFFRLSKYQGQLLEHIEKHPEFIQPEIRRNEIVSFIKTGLRDFSVSRASGKWGIPTPNDPEHTIYVWFDALINYVSGIGFTADPDKFAHYWPADVHVIGKDITRFHCVYWPAMLMSVGLPLPKQVFGHGWLHLKGQKMSKSRGIYVDPIAAVKEHGADAIRYYLMREFPFGGDGDFSEENFVQRYNSDLANDLGNLLNRTLTLASRNCDQKVPAPGPVEGTDQELIDLAEQTRQQYVELMDAYAFSTALENVWQLVRRGNKYIDENAPWALAKEGKRERLGTVLYNCLEVLRFAAAFVEPVMPEASAKIRSQMGLDADAEYTLDELATWGQLPVGAVFGEIKPIFPRLNAPKKAEAEKPKQPVGKAKAAKADQIGFDEFKKLDLRVAQVLSAERIAGADKLLKLQVDLGDEQRQVVAGVAEHYSPDEIVGHKIILVANLKPAMIRGVESQGMLLAAVDKKSLSLATVLKDMKLGTKVS